MIAARKPSNPDFIDLTILSQLTKGSLVRSKYLISVLPEQFKEKAEKQLGKLAERGKVKAYRTEEGEIAFELSILGARYRNCLRRRLRPSH